MKRRVIAMACIAASAACSSTNKDVAIRPLNAEVTAAAQDALARGDLLFSRGEHALALDSYRRAMRKDSADVHALNGMAISYAAMGRHDLAREFFERALARAPKDERIYRNFARSLTAQGRQSEANALMAQVGGAAAARVAAKSRPTLAQIASSRLEVPIAAAAGSPRSGLERVSMGEVRLRTADGNVSRSLLPGRVTAGLSTMIVTVANGAGSTPVSLTRELTAPISKPAAKLAALGDRSSAQAGTPARLKVAPAKTTSVKAIASAPRGAAACPATASGVRDSRLPATGLSIDLPVDRKEKGKCSSLAGGEQRDRSFEQLWQWSTRLG